MTNDLNSLCLLQESQVLVGLPTAYSKTAILPLLSLHFRNEHTFILWRYPMQSSQPYTHSLARSIVTLTPESTPQGNTQATLPLASTSQRRSGTALEPLLTRNTIPRSPTFIHASSVPLETTLSVHIVRNTRGYGDSTVALDRE